MLDFMQPTASFPRILALLASLLLALLAPGAASAADEQPDFSGVWLFNVERSDDLRARIEQAAGPDFTRGDVKEDLARVWIRRWLLSVIEDPESRYLTIEQSPKDFRTGLGDEVSTFYFGREASSRGPLGGTLKVKVHWQGPQLVTEEKSGDGGRITAVYTMLPGDETLIVALRLEHKKLVQPLEVRMFFDRHEELE